MGTYLSAIKRFWWLIIVGVAVSAGAYVVVLNHVNGIPPKLSTRFHPTYKASTQLLLTSSNHPFIRTATITTDTVTVDDKVKVQTGAHAPDITTLLNAANLYPRLINSDQVAKIRKAKFGDLPGKVTSEPVAGPQFQTQLPRLCPSPRADRRGGEHPGASDCSRPAHGRRISHVACRGAGQGKDPHQPANPHLATRRALQCNDAREASNVPGDLRRAVDHGRLPPGGGRAGRRLSPQGTPYHRDPDQ